VTGNSATWGLARTLIDVSNVEVRPSATTVLKKPQSVGEKTYGNLTAVRRRCTTKLCEHCVKLGGITCASCEEIMCPACHPSGIRRHWICSEA
jgi:hypothetical protein